MPISKGKIYKNQTTNMLKRIAISVLIFHILISDCRSALLQDIANTSSAECSANSLQTSLYCSGVRAINKMFNNLSKTNKPIVIVRGLEVVPIQRNTNDSMSNNIKQSNKEFGVGDGDREDYTLLSRFAHYLRTHELSIKFSNLVSFDEIERYLPHDTEQNGMQVNLLEEARKKDKGNSMIMTLGLILAKIITVMGLGGIGALAMKALGVATTALMMALMVGVKSVTHPETESSHSVQYITGDGHHRRRRRRSTRNNSNFSTFPSTLSKMKFAQMELPSLVYKVWQQR